jgi:hypothetical protein
MKAFDKMAHPNQDIINNWYKEIEVEKNSKKNNRKSKKSA